MADNTIHVLAVRPTGATHYRVECLSGGSRQWWNGSALVGTEPAATSLTSDRADGLLAFDVVGLPAGDYAVAFFTGASGTVVGVPLAATVDGPAAILGAAFDGSMTFADFLKLAAAVLVGNSTNNGLYFTSPADNTTVRVQASVDSSGNRTVSTRNTS